MSELPPPPLGTHAAGAAASSGSTNGSTFEMVHQSDSGQASKALPVGGPPMSPLVARKSARWESTSGVCSDPESSMHSVAATSSDTSQLASINHDNTGREEQGGHNGTGEEDHGMRLTAGHEEDEDDELGTPNPPRQFFRFTVDSTLPLGVSAFSPDPDVSILWQVRGVTEGSHAEQLGIEKNHYIYSVCGKRVLIKDRLAEIILTARQESATFQLVTTDTCMRKGRPRKRSADENALPPVFDRVPERDEAWGVQNARMTGPAQSDAASSVEESAESTEEIISSLPVVNGESGNIGSPTKQTRNLEVAASPAVRKAISIQNSPASKSPYHSFPRAMHSVVPAGTNTGTVSLNFDILRHELRRHVKACTRNLCIFPPDDRPWLDYALNLVFATLWYNAPDRGLGWDRDDDQIRLLGIKAALKGPQPWMATRSYVVSCVTDMLEAEGSDWICSESRIEALRKFHEPRIKKHLKAWKEELSRPSTCQSLQLYANGVWSRFVHDHLSGDDRVGPVTKLTERYVCIVADVIDERKMCPPVSGVSMSKKQPQSIHCSPPESVVSEISRHVKGMCSCVTNGCTFCKCKKLRYDVFPFARDLDFVTKVVVRRFQDNHIRLLQSHITYDSVRAVLDDLEDESSFITRLNKLFIVTIKASGVPKTGGIVCGTRTCDSGSSREVQLEGRTRTFSTDKVLGARVYAAFTDEQYYWGQITKVNSTKKKGGIRTFEVTFEDGDVNTNVSEEEMITEMEYIPIFEVDPPEPESGGMVKQHEKKRRRVRRREQEKVHHERSDLSLTRNKSSGLSSGSTASSAFHEIDDLVTPQAFWAQYSGQQEGNWSLRKLYMKRCGICVLCTMPECGLCSACVRRSHRAAEETESTLMSPEVDLCLRKICCRVLVKRRAQPAVGFSRGWMFYSVRCRQIPSVSLDHKQANVGIRIVSPEGHSYTSIEQAASRGASSQIDKATAIQLFRAHVGLQRYKIDLAHFLLGRGYCYEWTNAQGRNLIIYGIVSRCIRSADMITFGVDYNEENRSFINQVFGCGVKASQEISSDVAWGGCANYERKGKVPRSSGSVLKQLKKDVPCSYLLVPEMRKEDIVEYNGIKLPKLTVVVRGHQLEFNVKQSSIQNAGYGLFVKCKSLTNDVRSKTESAKVFLLKAGELLDMGVYGPLRPEDRKSVHVYNIKSYIFSGRSDELCFSGASEDSVFDITDDKTGEKHEMARWNCLTYINECGPDDAPTIHAKLDPEGCVHYVMGTRYNGDWNRYKEESANFKLIVDGDEVEVFLHYGQSYQPIRVRKEYSTSFGSSPTLEDQEEHVAAAVTNTADYVNDIASYSTEEVVDCISFLVNQCIVAEEYKSTDKRIDAKIRDRAQRVVRRLHDRAGELLQIAHSNNDASGENPNGDHPGSATNPLSEAVANAVTFISLLNTLPRELTELSGVDGNDSGACRVETLNPLFSDVVEQASDESFV